MTLADRIVIFDKGRIQQVGTPGEVFNRPANLFVAGFIGTPTMNLFPARLVQEGGRALLRGTGLELPAPPWLPAVAAGPAQALVVGVRPQSFKPADTGATLALQVEVVEYLGTESQVAGPLQGPGGQRVAAMLPGDAKALLHQRLALAVEPDALHVFDADSGLSLKP
jgi:ABC-type sugar transport system ATPase subunit